MTSGQHFVRLFLNQGPYWGEVTEGVDLTAEQMQAGLQLGLEGRDIARGLNWDGTATVRITSGTQSSQVMLHVAPMLTHHHNQTNQQLLVAPFHEGFEKNLAQAAQAAKMPQRPHVFKDSSDPWTQDWVEPTYASMPTAEGAQQMRLLLRSDQEREMQDRLYELRGPGVGVINMRAPYAGEAPPDEPEMDLTVLVPYTSRSSFGNVETIPPHGKYPAGRIIIGSAPQENPTKLTIATFHAQGVQDPLLLDTSWLSVRHVDEFIQFLPAKTPLGFRIAVADPTGAVEVLRQAQARRLGRSAVISNKGSLNSLTVDQFLADRDIMKTQQYAQRKINENLALVLKETGATASDVVRIPVLFAGWQWAPDGPGAPGAPTWPEQPAAPAQVLAALPQSVRAQVEGGRLRNTAVRDDVTAELSAFLPAAINSIVAAQGHMLVAEQFGPKRWNQDMMGDAVTKAYAKAGMKVTYLDDYDTYHAGGGEVHCGTNSLRAMTPRWWTRGRN